MVSRFLPLSKNKKTRFMTDRESTEHIQENKRIRSLKLQARKTSVKFKSLLI